MSTDVSTEQLVKDLKAVVRDAEDLVKATAGEVGEKARDARVQLVAAIQSAKQSCADWEAKAIETAKATDKVIREHPYQSFGLAFLVGVVTGVLVARR